MRARRRLRASSRTCPLPGDGRPQDREARVERERAAVVAARLDAAAETRGDVAAVEELEGVLRAEPEGALRPRQGGAALAGARERPAEDVVARDAGALLAAEPRQLHRVREVPAVVGVEERDVEVVAHAVHGEQTLDDAD